MRGFVQGRDWYQLLIIVVVASQFSASIAYAERCESWFKQAKILPGKECMLKCALIPADIDTFDCNTGCPTFCGESGFKDSLFQLSDLYPHLTGSERALIAEYPAAAMKVFSAKDKAENLCRNQFGSNRSRDESDACRHFVWAIEMRRGLDAELATKFLDAHEDQTDQLKDERDMDINNNRRGLESAKKLMKSGSFTERDILKELQTELKSKSLAVIERKNPEWRPK